jgi:hypothetical protein
MAFGPPHPGIEERSKVGALVREIAATSYVTIAGCLLA